MSAPPPLRAGTEIVQREGNQPVGGIEARLYKELCAVRDLIAPKAEAPELALFAQVCQHLDLDPFAGQIVLIGRWDSQAGKVVHRHQVTVSGRRAIAGRTGRLRGIEGPMWCGPRVHAVDCRCAGTAWVHLDTGELARCPEGGELVWREVWDDDDEFPYCARALVHVAGWAKPANGTAKWTEFAQTSKEGKLTPIWAAMPSHMIGKVAESLALRRAFPEVEVAVAGGWPGDAMAEADDAAVLGEASADETGEIAPVAHAAAADAAGAAAPGLRRPVERRRRHDEVPLDVYDNLPEAQGGYR